LPGKPVAIVKPGKDLTKFGRGGRGPLAVSPTGRTLASIVGGYKGAFSDVIDLDGAIVRARLDGAAFAITDDVVIVDEGRPSDYPSGGFLAVDIDSGATLWRFPAPKNVDRFELENVDALGRRIVAQYRWSTTGDPEHVIAMFDLATGERQTLLRQSRPRNWLYALLPISTPRHIALATDLGIDSAVYDELPISILDVSTGQLTRDAFVIDTPWICFSEWCIRDEP
jgi:hypothetical protein